MDDFKVSLEELLVWCRKVDANSIQQRMLFFECEEHVWIHYVHRLLVLLEGHSVLDYPENGVNVTKVIHAPAFLFCAKKGRLTLEKDSSFPNKMLSFSYYPTYIRSMMIDFDGITPPPTSRDIYYHTAFPIDASGMKLLELIEALHSSGNAEDACELLPLLFKLTVRNLQTSSLGTEIKPPKLWEQIKTFLREHRNEPISRSQVAKVFRISNVYVSELCKKYTGESFSRLKLRYQLEHAENLLVHTRLSVDEIAEQSGFSGANYFIRRFKQIYGKTPHVYRNNS